MAEKANRGHLDAVPASPQRGDGGGATDAGALIVHRGDIEWDSSAPPRIQRDFVELEATGGPLEHAHGLCVHQNGLCCICPGRGHPVMRREDGAWVDPVVRVHLDGLVPSKQKKGALKARIVAGAGEAVGGAAAATMMQPGLVGTKRQKGVRVTARSVVARLVTQQGREYAVRACVDGHLLEVNEALLTHPALVQRCWGAEGFVAIVQPKQPVCDGCEGACVIRAVDHHDGP